MSQARLLVVEDEETLRDLLARYLTRAGHDVQTCSSAAEALAAFEASPAGYDLVVTDLTLEPMNGAEMLERMRAKNPRIKAVITSGYPYQPQLAGVEFLQKPFLPKMLTDTVARALARAGGAGS